MHVSLVLFFLSGIMHGVYSQGPWKGEHVSDLHQQYYNIFKHGNRNAASHLWSQFLLDRSHEMTAQKFTYMNSGFCAVSGSPVTPQDNKRYRVNLDMVGGGKRTGFVYHCCWPCICDTQDFIRVDTKTVALVGGEVRQFHFTVIGNPCDHPEELKRPFVQPFYGRGETTLKQEAAEVRCDESGRLEGAYLSDGGYIIIGMLFDEDPALKYIDHSELEEKCAIRAQDGYNSGMGQIFRKVAAISPVPIGANKTLGISVATKMMTTSSKSNASAGKAGSNEVTASASVVNASKLVAAVVIAAASNSSTNDSRTTSAPSAASVASGKTGLLTTNQALFISTSLSLLIAVECFRW